MDLKPSDLSSRLVGSFYLKKYLEKRTRASIASVGNWPNTKPFGWCPNLRVGLVETIDPSGVGANQMSDMLQLVVEIGNTEAMILPVTSHLRVPPF